MRSPASFPHMTWAAMTLAAFATGYYLAGDLETRSGDTRLEPGTRELSAASAEATQSSQKRSVVGKNGKEGTGMRPAEARARVFQVLAEPNRVERFARLGELLGAVSAENWREVMDAFHRQTAFEGRELGDEWKLMLQRVGTIAREEAVLDALQGTGSSRDHRARNTLEGWIMADAAAAVAWVKTQPAETQEILNGAVVYGLARTSPIAALDYALGLSNPATRDWGIGEIVNGAVQEGGFRRGEEVLASALNRTDVGDEIKQRLFQDLARKRLLMDRMKNTPMDSLQWLDPYLTGDQSPAAPRAVLQVVAGAAVDDPAKVLQWLDARAERLTPSQTIPGYSTLR